MLYYKTCPYCGAHLDPGEHCDCTKERSEKMNPQKLRLEAGLSQKELSNLMRLKFPRYNKGVQSMVENPKDYGVKWTSEAEQYAAEAFRTPSKDTHRKRYSLRCRVTESRYAKVKLLIEQEGRFATVQDWLDHLIDSWIRQKETAALSSTEYDGKENLTTANISESIGDVNANL